MLWSVPQGLFFPRNDVPGFVGHAFDHFWCFYLIFEARLAVSGIVADLCQAGDNTSPCTNTLHVIIVPGVGQMCKLFFGTPRVNRKWDWAILTHGVDMVITNKWFSYRKSRSVNNFSSSRIIVGFGISMGFHSPGQSSRQDESTPRDRFLNFTLRV